MEDCITNASRVANDIFSVLYALIAYFEVISFNERDLTEEELNMLERYYELAGKAKRIDIEFMQEHGDIIEMEED